MSADVYYMPIYQDMGEIRGERESWLVKGKEIEADDNVPLSRACERVGLNEELHCVAFQIFDRGDRPKASNS